MYFGLRYYLGQKTVVCARLYFLLTLCFIKKQIVNILEGPKLINMIFMRVYV